MRQAGRRPAIRKPETLYALAPDAERLFPKAYHLLLNELLATLEKRYTPNEVQDLLTEVGRNLAPESGREELTGRANAAIAVLSDLGGLAELEEGGDGMVIREGLVKEDRVNRPCIGTVTSASLLTTPLDTNCRQDRRF